MELRHLRYFVAVADDENFHRAADRLHISQPALSRQVRELADEIGVALLEPAGRGVRLTDAGRLFADRARAILGGVEATIAETRRVAQGQLGTVRVGFETGAFLTGALVAIAAGFRARVPRIALDLAPMSSVEQWDALLAGDIAFGYGFYVPTHASLSHFEIARDALGVVMSRGHRLAQRARLTMKDLTDEPVLLQPRRLYPRLHDDIIAAARAHGLVLNLKAEVVDGEALLAQVAIGDAVTFAGKRQSAILNLTSVIWKPVSDLRVFERHVVAWRRNDASPNVRALTESCRELKAARYLR